MAPVTVIIDNLPLSDISIESRARYKSFMRPSEYVPYTCWATSWGSTPSSIISWLMAKAAGLVLENRNDPVSVKIPVYKDVAMALSIGTSMALISR